MRISIQTEDHLRELIEDHDLPLASPAIKVIRHILSIGYELQVETIIEIASILIPASYYTNPSMLARNLRATDSYKYIRAVATAEGVTINASFVMLPSSFKERAFQRIKFDGYFKVRRITIPPSYLENPYQLASLLGRMIGLKIAVIAKTNHLIWKLTNKPF